MKNSTRKNVFTNGIRAAAVAVILAALPGCMSGPAGGPHPFTTMFRHESHLPQQVVKTSELPNAEISQATYRR